MLNVHFTVDVEVWCGGWHDIDRRFSQAFKEYIYGPTANGDHGLPLKLSILNDYGLTGVFFVEPLFALRFGQEPLAEIVGLIQDAGQPVELHLHTEWVDEARERPFPEIQEKRQHLRYFSLEQQIRLLEIGLELIGNSGAQSINAFRAGSFGFNLDTLAALQAVGIAIDCSYNATRMGPDSGLRPGEILTEPVVHNGVHELPLTVYRDRPGHLRHLQLCACSTAEIEDVLWKALEAGRKHVVILSHSFELLHESRKRPAPIVVKRFERLCRFLDTNRDSFSVTGFNDYQGIDTTDQPEPVTTPLWMTGLRMLEQVRGRYA